MKFIKYINHKIMILKMVKKIDQLEIEKAGLDKDNTPYIKLKNGPVFFGINTADKINKFYYLLSPKIKKILPQICFRVAMDIIIRYIEAGLKYEGPKKEAFYKVQRGDQVAEMGAYMGYYVMLLSQKVGDTGRVIAIEPISNNIRILKKNIEANNMKNVVIVEKGVWNKKEQLNFYQNKGDNQSSSLILKDDSKNKYNINVDSLDNIFSDLDIDSLDFTVIQLNGAEFKAIHGLTKFKPKNFAIAARYKEENTNIVQDIIELMEKRGYKIQILENDYIYCQLNGE